MNTRQRLGVAMLSVPLAALLATTVIAAVIHLGWMALALFVVVAWIALACWLIDRGSRQ